MRNVSRLRAQGLRTTTPCEGAAGIADEWIAERFMGNVPSLRTVGKLLVKRGARLERRKPKAYRTSAMRDRKPTPFNGHRHLGSPCPLDSCNDLNVTFPIQTYARDQVDCNLRKPAPQCAAGMWIPCPRSLLDCCKEGSP